MCITEKNHYALIQFHFLYNLIILKRFNVYIIDTQRKKIV